MARVGSIDGGVPVWQPAHARLAAPDSSAPVSEGDDKRDAAAVASALGMGDKGDFAPMWLPLLPCDGVRPEKSPHPCALGCHPRAPAAGSSAMEKAHLPNSHRPNPSLQGFHYPTLPTAPLLSAGLPAHKRCVLREGCLLRGIPPSSPPSSCPKQRRRRAAARPSACTASEGRDLHAQWIVVDLRTSVRELQGRIGSCGHIG